MVCAEVDDPRSKEARHQREHTQKIERTLPGASGFKPRIHRASATKGVEGKLVHADEGEGDPPLHHQIPKWNGKPTLTTSASQNQPAQQGQVLAAKAEPQPTIGALTARAHDAHAAAATIDHHIEKRPHGPAEQKQQHHWAAMLQQKQLGLGTHAESSSAASVAA